MEQESHPGKVLFETLIDSVGRDEIFEMDTRFLSCCLKRKIDEEFLQMLNYKIHDVFAVQGNDQTNPVTQLICTH